MSGFRYIGTFNSPDYWDGFTSKRYVFQSPVWTIYLAQHYITPRASDPILGRIHGEIECNTAHYFKVYDFKIDEEGTFILQAPFRLYIEGYDKLPVPKYVVQKIKDVLTELRRDEQYLNKIKVEKPLF